MFLNVSNFPFDKCRYCYYVTGMEKVIKIVERIGFPAAVCVFLLYVVFVTLANNTLAINNLTTWLQSKSVTIVDK